MSDEQRATLDDVFAGLISRGEVDIVPADQGDGLEIQADQWTLVIEGDPLMVAFLAVDDEPGDPADIHHALSSAIEPGDLASLRQLDHRWEGSLRIALQQSGDMLSMQLATLLAEDPETRA